MKIRKIELLYLHDEMQRRLRGRPDEDADGALLHHHVADGALQIAMSITTSGFLEYSSVQYINRFVESLK